MEKTVRFKTNIHCGGCVRSVSGFLNEVEGVRSWEVDVNSSDKILSVSGQVHAEAIVEAVEEAGFEAVLVE